MQQQYEFAVIATDVVIFTVEDDQLKVLLIKMKKKPFTDMWAAPGGLIEPDESVDNSAKRILKQKAGVSGVHLEQLYTFGDVNRDPFGRVVSVGYFALIPSTKVKIKTTDEYQDIQWFPVKKLPKLAYDHKTVIATAVTRLKTKLEYTNMIYSLLPKEFTLTELRKMYQIILNKKLDKRNFIKKILSLKILKKLSKVRKGGASRPAALYSFKELKIKEIEII